MKIGREAAKQMFRDDKHSQGCYRSAITKIDMIYDSFEKQEQVENNELLHDVIVTVCPKCNKRNWVMTPNKTFVCMSCSEKWQTEL